MKQKLCLLIFVLLYGLNLYSQERLYEPTHERPIDNKYPGADWPEEQIEGLKKLGDWMAINKEALYGTTPAPFLMTGTDQWEAGSIRFTQKGEYLYAIDLERPELPYKIPGVLAHEGSEIKMLGSNKSLKWRQIYDDDDSGEIIIEELPEELPCDYAWSFKIQVVDKTWETYINEK